MVKLVEGNKNRASEFTSGSKHLAAVLWTLREGADGGKEPSGACPTESKPLLLKVSPE